MARRILFITSNRLGDAVLSTGLLNYLVQNEPEAKVTIACGHLPAPLFAAYPLLDKLIPFKKERYNLHWIRLWRKLVGTHWDMVIDLRNSALSRLVPARKRYIYGPHIDKGQHKVRQAAQTMGLDIVPDPRLWFSDEQVEKAAMLIPEGSPVLAIGPTANWAGKTWSAENFIALIAALTSKGGILPDARVAIFAAAGEEKIAYQVLSSIPENKCIDMIAKADPALAAACLSRCALYIGNDSGLMHCASATGIPTFGLFGPSWPHLYAPWGGHSSYAATEQDFDALTAFTGYDPKTCGSLMTGLKTEDVLKKITLFWNERVKNKG